MLFAWIIISCMVDKAVLVKLSVFDSPPALKNILRLENSLNKYLVRMRSQNTKYITSLNQAIDRSFKQKRWNMVHSANHFLRRQNTTHLLQERLKLQNYMKQEISNTFVLKESNKDIFSGAAFGLSLLQNMYNVKIDSMTNGSVIVSNKEIAVKSWNQFKEKLSCFDFIILSLFAFKVSWYTNAQKYLSFASECIDGNPSNLKSYKAKYQNIIDSLHHIAQKAIALQQENEEFEFESRFLPFITARRKGDIKGQHRKNPKSNTIKKALDYNRLIQKVCNSQYRAPSHAFSGELEEMKCNLVHNNNPYLRLGPFMYEIKRILPFRAIIHGILSSYEIDQISKFILPELTYEKSESLLIYNDSPSEAYEDHFKASTLYFNTLETDPNVMRRISRKVQLATYLIFNEDGRRGKFKGALYGLGGMTEEHSDAYGVEDIVNMSNEYKKYFETAGDIIATVIFWMCDTGLGGGTYFCSKNAEDVAIPEKGSAVVWTSLRASGFRDNLQDHGGCPVGLGKKFIITQWFNQYFQYQQFPCDTIKSTRLNMYQSLYSFDNEINKS